MRIPAARSVFGILIGFLCIASSTGRADSLETAAKKLAKGATHLKNLRVAVLIFPYENGDISSGSTLVSEQLTTLLADRKNISLVERNRLASLLGEMKLEESGITSSTAAAHPGGMMSVDAVVTGTLTDDMVGGTEVNARLIRLETGEILAAATMHVARSWDDRPHPPPGPVEDPDDTSQYVMHASPLILTPWARGGSGPRAHPEAMVAEYPGGEPTSAAPPAMYLPPQTVTNTFAYPVAPQRPTPQGPTSRAAAPSAAQAQLYYAMGLTLDQQGHRAQAAHYYQKMLRDMPASTPLRQRAQDRLATKN